MAIQQFETAYLQIVRRITILLLVAATVTGCSKEETPDPPAGPAQQTILLYMPGQNLLSYYVTNVRNIKKAVTDQVPGNNRILVCYQPDSHTQATLLEVRYDKAQQQCIHETLRLYEEFYPERPESVETLFRDIQQLAPAEHYGLIIGCHGTAWLPPAQSLSNESAPGVVPTPSLLTRAENETDAAELFTRAFGDSGHRMEISDFATVVNRLPYRFDYLIFDGCFMANIETLYDLRNAFDYVIASPCEILAAGFPYDRITPHLFTASGADLAAVCDDFWSFYMYDWNTVPNNAQSGCISLAVMSELEALAECVADIQAGPLREYDRSQLQFYESMSTHLFYDLGDYLSAICDNDAHYARFEEQLDRAFPKACRLNTPQFYSVFNGGRQIPVNFYTGVSTSEPANRYESYEQETAWYRRTHRLP